MAAFLQQLPDMQPEQYRALALGENAEERDYDAGLEAWPTRSSRCWPNAPVATAATAPAAASAPSRSLPARARPISWPRCRPTRLDSAAAASCSRPPHRSTRRRCRRSPATTRRLRRRRRRRATRGPAREIARRGVPADGIPACVSCHEPEGGRYPAYPALRGQTADYIAQQLRLFKDGIRGGTPYAHIMETVARRMSDAQIEAVAAYFGTSLDRPVRRLTMRAPHLAWLRAAGEWW